MKDYSLKRINHTLMNMWLLIVMILMCTYIFEVVKGERTITYVIEFSLFWLVPYLICLVLYKKNNFSKRLRYAIVYGYMISYAFCIFSSQSLLVFVYVLPLLSSIILYHDADLVLHLGAVSLTINAVDIVWSSIQFGVTVVSSRDSEIQIFCLLLCFIGCYMASNLYEEIHRSSEKNLKQTQETALQTIAVIANTVDAKDPYTEGHSRRVATYSYAIAKKLGMSDEEADNIRTIGLLHDIGKIGIPDSVLHKPGKLTEDEYNIMKMHPTIGAQILKDITILDGLEVGAHYHHERYDGLGYPDGLKGEDIPYVARIICVADCFDAMHSNRIYRSRFSMEYILNELKNNAGTQFDPLISEAMVELIENNELQGVTKDDETTTLEDMSSETEDKMTAKGVYLLDEIEQKNIASITDFNLVSTEDWSKKFRTYVQETLVHSDGQMFIVDVDNMGIINDTYGYGRGDQVLQSMYRTLCSKPNILLNVRTGGDEFLCWVERTFTEDEYKKHLEVLLSDLINNAINDTGCNTISISIGATTSIVSGRDFDSMVNDAHKSLYYVKKTGKNAIDIYSNGKTDTHIPQAAVEHDLNAIAQIIAYENDYKGAYHTDYQGFEKIYNLLRNLSNRYLENVQLILFTMEFDDRSDNVTVREVAMNILESAIVSTLRKTDVTTRYSTTQQLLLLMNINDENMKMITDRIMKTFYQMYDKGNVTLMTSTKNVSMEKLKYNPHNQQSS